MHTELLEFLVDPKDQSPLSLDVERREGNEVITGRLTGATGSTYQILNAIPRFVSPETYADNFGMQWNRFRARQLDTAQMGDLSRSRFPRETRWTVSELRGKWVLDVGCGAGRFSEVAAGFGGRLVAIDLSSAVEATAETLRKHHTNVDVIQASALNLPFRTGAFDFAYCIGVVQHTPDRARVINETIRCVRGQGEFAFTIYGRRPWTKANGKYLARNVTRRLPPPRLLRLVEQVMPYIFPVTDRLFALPVIGRVARFVSPVATYTSSERPNWTTEQRYQEALLDTFDALAPRYDEPMTWREVETVIKKARAKSWSFVSKVPVIVVGKR